MPIDHLCSDKCFSKRNSLKNKVLCMKCDHSFNPNCFKITSNEHIKLIHSNANVKFMCDKCNDDIIKSKQLNRRFSNALKPRLSAPSLDGTAKTASFNKYSSPLTLPSASRSSNIKKRGAAPSDDLSSNVIINLNNTEIPSIDNGSKGYVESEEAALQNNSNKSENHSSVSPVFISKNEINDSTFHEC